MFSNINLVKMAYHDLYNFCYNRWDATGHKVSLKNIFLWQQFELNWW